MKKDPCKCSPLVEDALLQNCFCGINLPASALKTFNQLLAIFTEPPSVEQKTEEEKPAEQKAETQKSEEQKPTSSKSTCTKEGKALAAEFLVFQSFLSRFGNWMVKAGEAKYLNVADLLKSIEEFIKLTKWLDGKKPELVKVSEDKKSATFYLDGKSLTVSYATYLIYQDQFDYSSKKEEHSTKEQSENPAEPTSEEKKAKEALATHRSLAEKLVRTLGTASMKCIVRVEGVSFDAGVPWTIKVGEDLTVLATITDPDFLKAIEEGKESFGRDDAMLVDLQITQECTAKGELMVLYTITKVYEHKSSVAEITL